MTDWLAACFTGLPKQRQYGHATASSLSHAVHPQVKNLSVARSCLETYFLEVRRCGS
jgi:hypothetical protein